MKKVLYLILLLSMNSIAQFNSGTISFNDGSSKSGFIKVPKYQDKKVRFKADEQGKPEKFSIDEVKDFEILNPKGETEKYTTIKLGNNKTFNTSKIRVDDDKNFVRVLNKKSIGIYVAHFKGNSVSGGNGTMRSHSYAGDMYFLQREGDDYAWSIGTHRYDLDFMTGISTYAAIDENFKDICPEFHKKLLEADLPVSRFAEFVDIYETTCAHK